jgi:hypothetical protein
VTFTFSSAIMLFLPGNVSRYLKDPYSDANCPLRLLARTLFLARALSAVRLYDAGLASGMASLRLAAQFLPGAAAPHAGWLFRHDVGSGTRGLVTDLDQDPAPLAGPGQRETPG